MVIPISCQRRTGEVDLSVLNVPEGGVSQTVRQSIALTSPQPAQRPVPGGGRPKPKPRMNIQSLPKLKALYDYEARDVDELSFTAGDVLDLVREREYHYQFNFSIATFIIFFR